MHPTVGGRHRRLEARCWHSEVAAFSLCLGGHCGGSFWTDDSANPRHLPPCPQRHFLPHRQSPQQRACPCTIFSKTTPRGHSQLQLGQSGRQECGSRSAKPCCGFEPKWPRNFLFCSVVFCLVLCFFGFSYVFWYVFLFCALCSVL